MLGLLHTLNSLLILPQSLDKYTLLTKGGIAPTAASLPHAPSAHTSCQRLSPALAEKEEEGLFWF